MQLENRLKNIESAVEQRFASNETRRREVVDKLSDNDTSVKSEEKITFDTQERSMVKLSAELTSGVTVSQAVTSASVKRTMRALSSTQ